MSRRVVLVVDDSEVVLASVQAVLSQTGARVEVHREPFGLIGKVVELRPDLIVMDLEMPVMRGDKMVEVLRRMLGAELPPVLLHSSAPVAELEERARACGAPSFIRKGDVAALLTRACQMLDSRRASP
jgi:CheY-like chemotaxis protein